jgi:hypothetical protein
MRTWPERLKGLQDRLEKSPEQIADMLGITVRTLGEFTRPEGREPSQPIQRLIEMLEAELQVGASSVGNQQSPPLTMVIIHGDFEAQDKRDVVTTIDDMTKAADFSGNVEFHYITVNPERDMQKALSILQSKRVTPHFFMQEGRLNPDNSKQAECSYFSTTVTWLASIAKKNNLQRITLAADVKDYWPIAKEIKALAEIDVSFIRAAKASLSEEQLGALEEMGISVIDPVGRHFGRIHSLSDDRSSRSGYGFLIYVRPGSDNEWIDLGGNTVFFSWNHMRKDGSGAAEIPISKLREGDIVGFAIGMNDKGPCATDVTLIERAPEPEAKSEQEPIDLNVLKDAVRVCADQNGWALVANVGSRLSILNPEYKDQLDAKKFKIGELLKKHDELFEYSTDATKTTRNAACARLKPAQQ